MRRYVVMLRRADDPSDVQPVISIDRTRRQAIKRAKAYVRETLGGKWRVWR